MSNWIQSHDVLRGENLQQNEYLVHLAIFLATAFFSFDKKILFLYN
jgi:hypothetical protein